MTLEYVGRLRTLVGEELEKCVAYSTHFSYRELNDLSFIVEIGNVYWKAECSWSELDVVKRTTLVRVEYRTVTKPSNEWVEV